MRIFFRIIFWVSICWLLLFLWVISFGQSNDFEFRNPGTRNLFYNLIFDLTPIAVMGTLSGTLKKKQQVLDKWLIVTGTVAASCFTVLYLLSHMFTLGFGSWNTTHVLYKHRMESGKLVVQQRYDAGALGYGRERVVVSEPRFIFFNKVSKIDTSRLNKPQWIYVNRQMIVDP